MSFITDIISLGLGRLGIQASGNTLNDIAMSAITDFISDKTNGQIKKSNPRPEKPTEISVSIDIQADVNASIPVVYGEAWVSPLLVDAVFVNNNCTMWYALALSEVTGNLINGTASVITFEEVWRNDEKLFFDGNTVSYAYDGQGNTNTDIGGTIQIYPYNNGSESPAGIGGSTPTHGNAYTIMPNWDSTFQMSSLVFALVRVDYTPDKNIEGIGNLRFKLKNTLTLPGDVLNDFMTNTRYGCGIPVGEIDQ